LQISEDTFLANETDLSLADMLYRKNIRGTRQSSEQQSHNSYEEIGRFLALRGFRVMERLPGDSVIVRHKGENRIIPISDLEKDVVFWEAEASNADGSRQAATARAVAVEAVAQDPHAANVADSGGETAAEADARLFPTFHTPPVDRSAEESSSLKGQTIANNMNEGDDGGAGARARAGAGAEPVSGLGAATLAKPRPQESGNFIRRKDWVKHNRVTSEILQGLSQELKIFSGSGVNRPIFTDFLTQISLTDVMSMPSPQLVTDSIADWGIKFFF
jgi:hypothetical protein